MRSKAASVFGLRPSGERLERMTDSAQYDKQRARFFNPSPNFSMGENRFAILRDALIGNEIRLPTEPLPSMAPDLAGFMAYSETLKFIWLGHSSILLRIDGLTVLIDPVFESYASPIPVFAKRFQPAVIHGSLLPAIDIVVLSHDHYDHLEMSTVKSLVAKGAHFVAPLGLGSHLEAWGVAHEKITELDWWQEATVLGLRLVAAPAQHFSGRRGVENNTLWASWLIQGKAHKVYYSGDSGYSKHYQEIGERLGPFDLSFIEDGQYNHNWIHVHQLPEQAVKAHLDLKAQVMVPVHWGAYVLSFHDWWDPAERVYRAAQELRVELLTPIIGELICYEDRRPSQAWWRQSRDFQRQQQRAKPR